MEKLHISWAVEGLPALLHLSLFLFFSGVLIFLFNINHTVFWWVIWTVGASLTMYGWISLVPIFRHDSPYYAPLSGSAWLLYTVISYAFFKFLEFVISTSSSYFTYQTWSRFRDLREHYYTWIVGGVEKAAEETASKQSSVIDSRILDWTLGTLGEDDLLEKFFDAIPGFFNSGLVKGLEQDFSPKLRWAFGQALGSFLHRTLASDSILDSVKLHRLIICTDAVDTLDVSNAFSGIPFGIEKDQLSLPQSIETGHVLARWCSSKDPSIANPMQRIVARILFGMWERGDCWIALAKEQFGLPEIVLRDNIAHGDNSVLLSILIHLTRKAVDTPYDSWPWKILSTVSRFDIHHAVPELQHEFCVLWNESLLKARIQGNFSIPVKLLRAIRHAYISLHQGTEAAPTAFSASTDPHLRILSLSSSYPLCTLTSHRSHSTPDSPHPIHGETQTLPAITTAAEISIIPSEANSVHATAQQARETIIIPSSTDFAVTPSDNTSPHIRPFPSASPTTEPVHIHIPLQVTSLPIPSVLTRDSSPPIQIPISRQSPQSTLSNAVPADPTNHIHTTETTETSGAAIATSLTFLHPDPILASVSPSTVPGLPSAVVSGQVDGSEAFQRTTFAAILSHPQESNKERDTATLSATTHISEISSTADTIPASATLERDEEATCVSPIVVSRSQLSPMPVPAPRSDVIPEELFSFIESPLIQSDPTLESPSSSATIRSQISPQVTSILDAHVTGSIRTVSEHDDSHGMDTPIPMEDLPHPNQSTAPASGVDPVAVPPEDDENGRNSPYRWFADI